MIDFDMNPFGLVNNKGQVTGLFGTIREEHGSYIAAVESLELRGCTVGANGSWKRPNYNPLTDDEPLGCPPEPGDYDL